MTSPVRAFAQLSAGRRGILWVVLTTLMFVGTDTIAKYLSQTYPVPQIVWARYAFHALVMAAVFGRRLPAMMRTRRPGLQLTRSVLVLIATVVAFMAFRVMPLADVTAIWATTPIMVTALSVPLLGERVGPRRWAGVAAGFVGALVIIRPGLGVMHPAAFLALASAVAMALFHLATRSLARTDSALTSLAYTAALGLVASCALAPFFWVAPDAWGWTLMAALGLLAGMGHFTLIKGLEAAPASTVIPFLYTNLLWATISGLVFFGDLPDVATVTGAVIIVSSGLYIFHRERAKRDEGRAP